MEFYVMAKSYNLYGAHTTLTPIANFLLMGAVDFGDAVKELTVTLYFRDSGPPKKNLQQLLIPQPRPGAGTKRHHVSR